MLKSFCLRPEYMVTVLSERSLYSIISVIAGVIGIIAVVCWHAKEYKIQYNKKPVFLLVASMALGFQSVFLAFQLIIN